MLYFMNKKLSRGLRLAYLVDTISKRIEKGHVSNILLRRHIRLTRELERENMAEDVKGFLVGSRIVRLK